MDSLSIIKCRLLWAFCFLWKVLWNSVLDGSWDSCHDPSCLLLNWLLTVDFGPTPLSFEPKENAPLISLLSIPLPCLNRFGCIIYWCLSPCNFYNLASFAGGRIEGCSCSHFCKQAGLSCSLCYIFRFTWLVKIWLDYANKRLCF